ncbi:hypothetical protein [Agromyces kandeliae]|uniref:Uncharacterized protein n=1 Tax=Agromyces kandeliae TaxID=2666141 RepID=A0A6L5R2L1_9MICO|nr:hypothetical protein [Agromyces kandeliae]MRX43794.1 hypothetical protein [Agromyces kandeliae]
MNTTLTAPRSTAQQVAAGSGRLQERLARRAGLALLAWSRAAEARRARNELARADVLARTAGLQREADRLREENFSALALVARTL